MLGRDLPIPDVEARLHGHRATVAEKELWKQLILNHGPNNYKDTKT